MKTKIEYNGIQFDSNEELEFYYYLEELKEAGFVIDFEYNTKSFTLSEPFKYKWTKKLKTKEVGQESTLLQGHIYTPDYYIHWDKKGKGIFYEILYDGIKLDKTPFVAQSTNAFVSYIEIKPSFDYQNMTRLSVINQKWMMKQFGIYVQKITPTGKNTCLFAKTFVPEKALVTKKKKLPKKFKYPVKSLKEFINGKK